MLATKSEFEKVAEALNDALSRAESVIRALGFAVNASVPLDKRNNHSHGPQLSFAKWDGRWGFGIRGKESGPWRSVNVDLKSQAARALPRLIKALIDARNEQFMDYERSLARLQEFVALLESGPEDIEAMVKQFLAK